MKVAAAMLNLLWFVGIVVSLAYGWTNGLLALIAVFLFDLCLDFKAYRTHVEAIDREAFDDAVTQQAERMTTTAPVVWNWPAVMKEH